jgi:hypothetical protein
MQLPGEASLLMIFLLKFIYTRCIGVSLFLKNVEPPCRRIHITISDICIGVT